jgi:adenylate cyclase
MRKMALFKRVKLRFEILFVFLSLIAATSIIIIAFTYHEDSKAIQAFSQETINRISTLIEERTNCMLHDVERIPEESIRFLLRHPQISEDNRELIAYCVEKVKFHPNLYAFYVGSPEGNAVIAFNLAVSDQPRPFIDAQSPIPEGAEFACIIVDQARSHTICIYLDKNLAEISSGEISFGYYDPRVRPWYVGAEKTGKLFWTDVFRYLPTNDLGIAASVPVFDQGKLIAVIGADLSLKLLAEFLASQKIGRAGRAFILDETGKILIPAATPNQSEAVAKAFEKYAGEGGGASVEQGREHYLVSIHPFPTSFKNRWYTAIIDPLTDYFAKTIQTQKEVVLISLAILFAASLLIVYFSNHISAPIMTLSKEVDKITHFNMESEERVKSDIEEIFLMDASIASLRSAMRSFSRYVPRDVVKNLIQKGQEIAIGGEKREIAIFFSDIAHFTPIAESFPVETVMELLSEYFPIISKIILDSRGTIDKYIGDGVMAFWGAPEDLPDHALRACSAALQSQQALSAFHQKWMAKGIPEFSTRIGVYTGSAIVGNFGTSERMNYTAIGDSVNAASRLEALNKIYQTKILVDEETVKESRGQFLFRPIDYVEVKGKKKKIKVYELINWKEKATQQEIALCDQFTKAYEAFHAQDLAEAKKRFQAIQSQFPNDYPTQYYTARG